MVLEGEGATVLEAATGEEALAQIESAEPIQVIITDVMMPGISGLELLERLAGAAGGTPEVPVILISGHATVDDAVKATRLGAFDFFEKPLARDRVVGRLVVCMQASDSNLVRREIVRQQFSHL